MASLFDEKVNSLFDFKKNHVDTLPKFRRKLSNIYGVSSENSAQNTYDALMSAYGGNVANQRINAADIINKYKQDKETSTGYKNPSIKYAAGKIKYEDISNPSGLETTGNNNNTATSDSATQFNSEANENSLASLDVSSELPKLTTQQISEIISKHFSKSTVIKPSDAQGIYNAQQTTGMSALAILGIGALESGYGTSNIAKKKNNIWGWNATNSNPMGDAKSFSQMSEGALQFANAYMNTYYNKYGAKSIQSAGTGSNPAGKGYAYNDDGTISSSWAKSVGSIMKNFYQTAKGVNFSSSGNSSQTNTAPLQNSSTGEISAGKKIANTNNYNNSAAKGQCVWYVRGRAAEKLGKDTGSIGNANEMWYNAKSDAKVSAKAENIKPNMIVSYDKGTSSAGQKYGHVIYIEAVVGDTVYYTEGGSGYHKNGTDGVVKTATKQGILNGINKNGSKIGSGVIGFIDMSKY